MIVALFVGYIHALLLAAVTIAPTPTPAPTAAHVDLRSLTYTAVAPLHVSFVTPAENAAEAVLAVQVTAATERGGGVALSINGTAVSTALLGERSIDEKTGETRYFFYGIPLRSGPNRLVLVPLGASGSRGAPIARTIYGPDVPVSLRTDLYGKLVADGKTPVMLRIWATDRYGHPALPGARVTLRILRGDAAFKGLSPGAAGDLVLPPGGFLEEALMPGLAAGPLEVEVGVGDVRKVERYYLNPYLRSPFVNGLVSLGAGAVPNPINGDGSYDGGGSRDARTALYANGRVGKNMLLTLAYESQNPLTELSSVGTFIDNPNERPYLTYGDSSTISAPLQSSDHLYARLDDGASSFMWGLFNAQVGAGDAGAYHQLLNGAKLELNLGTGQRVNLTGFTARNDVAYATKTLPVLGLAALQEPLNPNIVVGSDYLQLVTLDRYTGMVIAQVPLVRNLDYTIDYSSGILRFINVPLPYDASFDPQVILVQYQYQGTGAQSQTTGANLRYQLGRDRHTLLEVGYVNDATGSQNFGLFSQQLSRTWATGSLSFSRAISTGGIPDGNLALPSAPSGTAYTFAFRNHDVYDDYNIEIQNTSAGFSNPFGGLNTPGLFSGHASFTRTLARRYALVLTADEQSNSGTTGSDSQSNLAASLRWFASSRLTLLAGLLHHGQNVTETLAAGSSPAPAPTTLALPSAAPLATQSQLQAQLGADYQVTKRVALSLQSYRTLSGSDIGSSQPSQTLAQVTYQLNGGGRAYLREFWSDQPTTTFADATSALTAASGAMHGIQLGFERPLSPATTVSTDYLITGSGGAEDIYSAIGVQEKIQIGKSLSGNANLQAADAAGPGAQGFTVWGGTLAYAANKNARATLSYQTRGGANAGSTLALGLAGAFSPNLSVVSAIQHTYSGLSDTIDDKLTVAYRPALDDRFISLFAYERSNTLNPEGNAGNVASFEEIYRPTERLELAAHFAYELAGDGYYTAGTSLRAIRVRVELPKGFDIGTEIRQANIRNVAGARETDVAEELGYGLGESARIAVGYNFSSGVDPTLTGPQRRGIYVTATTLVDRVFGWGKP